MENDSSGIPPKWDVSWVILIKYIVRLFWLVVIKSNLVFVDCTLKCSDLSTPYQAVCVCVCVCVCARFTLLAPVKCQT